MKEEKVKETIQKEESLKNTDGDTAVKADKIKAGISGNKKTVVDAVSETNKDEKATDTTVIETGKDKKITEENTTQSGANLVLLDDPKLRRNTWTA